MKNLAILLGIILATSQTLAFQSEVVLSGTAGTAVGGSGAYHVGLHGEYLHHLVGPLQIGGELGYTQSFGDLLFKDKSFSFLVGPTLNFSPDDLANSTFVSARLGLYYSEFIASRTDLRTSFSLGKRFAINDSITYRPDISWSKTGESEWSWIARPIAFSIVF